MLVAVLSNSEKKEISIGRCADSSRTEHMFMKDWRKGCVAIAAYGDEEQAIQTAKRIAEGSQWKFIPDEPHATTDEIVQFCLDNGVGIQYDESTPCYTTELERQTAKPCGCKLRYVGKKTIDSFKECFDPDQLTYAVRTGMCMLDLDEWAALQKALGVKMDAETAGEINAILWEDMDQTPLEFEAVDYSSIFEEKKSSVKTEEDALRIIMGDDVPDDTAEKIVEILRDKLKVSVLSLVTKRLNES